MTTPTPVQPAQPAAQPRSSGGPSQDTGKLHQAADGPILPIALLLIGGYLTWFGVHYWRSDVKWPTDPIKAILTGKPLPDPKNTSDAGTIVTYGKLLAPAEGSGGGTDQFPNSGGTVGKSLGNQRISADALRYIGQGYNFGGNASQPGNWDCSSFCSYVLGHDLGLPLPGGKWGDPGFPPHAHGPTTGTYLLYGTPINRTDLSPGDLVVWQTHMGIAINGSQLVAARNGATGTGLSNIDGTTTSLGETPHYRRVNVA